MTTLPVETAGAARVRKTEVVRRSVGERAAAGKTARAEAPRSAHAILEAPPESARSDLTVGGTGGVAPVAEVVPIRHGRMLVSPFAFYRGAALIMASDLARTPRSGWPVQACGDAPMSNFGVFASPAGTS